MTPEGVIKQKIKKLLDSYGDHLYVFMPVPGGYGTRTLDFLGCACGVFFAVEAKRPGKGPTAFQEGTLEKIRASGGIALVVNDDASLAELKRWLDSAMRVVSWSVGA